ncbi:lipase 3-like [Ctenocephalides felis]|uniref:lipase 3-like n=1 Tax=Ctenocephalides felis TaxID=7515 RepID=UPI000E6E2BC6|nr:lipase 3-like [Ctenocephalides felis]
MPFVRFDKFDSCTLIARCEVHSKHQTRVKLISENGFPVKKYEVTTEDGYILTLHRISNPAGHPVLLIPGLMSTAADFVTIGQKSLGFFLFKMGFDVWLGNPRGTTFSRSHINLNPDTDKEFWNFSFHEIGFLDLPALIDAILMTTGHISIQYVGHSQGCTALMVLLAEKPEYNAKISTAHLMAPAVFMGNTRSPILMTVSALNPHLQRHSRKIGIFEFYPTKSSVSTLWKTSCLNMQDFLSRTFCTNFIYLLGGANDAQFNYDYIQNIAQNYPGGTSAKQLDHFSQLVQSKKFTKFNYERSTNMKLYGSENPPEYSWKNINTKIYIYYGSNDILTVPEDVMLTANALKSNLIQLYNIPDQMFTHTDFLWAKDADILVYQKLGKDLLSNL